MKQVKIFLIILLIFILLGGIWFFFHLKKKEEIIEYVPQQEISDEQLRQTFISLCFMNKQTKELEMEERTIDVKLLLENPYELLVQLLLEGPKKETLEAVIPEGTTLHTIQYEKGKVTMDLKNSKVQPENGEKILQSITKTLTTLTEVEEVKLLLDGQEVSF